MYWQVSVTIMSFGDQGGGERNGSKTCVLWLSLITTCALESRWQSEVVLLSHRRDNLPKIDKVNILIIYKIVCFVSFCFLVIRRNSHRIPPLNRGIVIHRLIFCVVNSFMSLRGSVECTACLSLVILNLFRKYTHTDSLVTQVASTAIVLTL